MNYKMLGRYHAWIFAALAVFMIPAAVLCLVDARYADALAFLYTILISSALCAGLFALCRRGVKQSMRAKEGLICVGLAWICMSLVGALPLWFSGSYPSFIDALFEIVSGFTTTGASVLSDVESLSRGILYWRSFSHWLGGMGVLVFLLAIVPVSGKTQGFTLHLMRAESPGPDVGKLVPRIRRTAAILYLTYIALTLLDVFFLVIGGMPLFDAVCTTFGTVGTGGFGIKNDSLAGYSPYIQTVTTVFMLLSGVNFSCYYLLMLKQVWGVIRDEELRLYLGVVATATVLVTLNVRGLFNTFGEALRHAAFQVSSLITTTGFSTFDYELWPTFSKAILLFLMLIGACAGSTGGGLKCARILLLVKGLARNIGQVLHPQKVQSIRINKKTVDERVLNNTNAYLFVYLTILVSSFVLVSLDSFANSPMTSFSAVLACFNNIGPGLDAVGPTCNYGGFNVFSKLVLIFDMLAGRLEIFPMLVLFSPRAWKKAG